MSDRVRELTDRWKAQAKKWWEREREIYIKAAQADVSTAYVNRIEGLTEEERSVRVRLLFLAART